MFGRLATVRIKAAEEAYAAGKLDVAFDAAISPELAGHERAKTLLQNIATELLRRGQDHLMARRFQQALDDFTKAARCGHLPEKVTEWHRRAQEAIQLDRRERAEHAAAVAEARNRMEAGSLDGAADAAARARIPDGVGAELRGAIERQGADAREALTLSEKALNEGNLPLAIEKLRHAKRHHKNLDGISTMEATLVNRVVGEAVEHFKSGRLHRAEMALGTLSDLGQGRTERVELEEAVRLAREAAEALTTQQYDRAGVLIGRLTQVGPSADWVVEVRGHLRELEEHRRELLEGPLGLILDGPNAQAGRRRIGSEMLQPPPVPPRMGAAPVQLPHEAIARDHVRHLIIRIDGVGSFLMLRGERFTIGRAGPGATADLQLISDLADRQAEIIRAGEDYFVVAKTGVELAGRQVDHALLQDGDRIRLGRRVKLTFKRPSLKSTSAVLELGEGVRTMTDCRRVILWTGPVLIGGTRECHIPLAGGLGDYVLTDRGGQVSIKSTGVGGAAVPISIGVTSNIGELRLTANSWPDASRVGKVIG